MTAQEAYDYLDPKSWAETSAIEKLALIEDIQKNLSKHAKALGMADAKMKNNFIGTEIYTEGFGIAGTAGPIAGMLMGSHHLYEKLVNGELLEPVSTKKLDGDITAIQTWPIFPKDKMLAGKQKGYLHVKGGTKTNESIK